tara:strand:+ start:2520 stop:2792 length:273 start_codon:yes stop_codon:yes gene_type:complete
MSIFRVVIEVDEPSLEDAEDHIESLNGSDFVDEIVEIDAEYNKGFASIDTEELDSACESLFGHTDWEFIADTNQYITIKFNVNDTREEEE